MKLLANGITVIPSASYSLHLAANANGTGAILKAFGFSEGQDLDITVSDIGRIQDIRIVSRGFDYVAAPNVSLRVQDVTVNPIANDEFYFKTTNQMYDLLM